MQAEVQKILKNNGISLFGACAFADVLPLLPCRAAARLPRDPKTVLVAVFPYKTAGEPQNLSRYATVPDYHTVCGGMLENAAGELQATFGGQFTAFVDNSPIREVKAAVLAGLGMQGKNGLLITQKYGSFVFIGEIVTDLALPTTAHSAFCADCGACTAACPAGCIGGDRSVCLSAVTQQKGELTEAQSQMMRDNGCIWGCDICQNVCPHNRQAQNTDIPAFLEGFRAGFAPGDPIDGRAFAWRGQQVICRNAGLIKNKPLA